MTTTTATAPPAITAAEARFPSGMFGVELGSRVGVGCCAGEGEGVGVESFSGGRVGLVGIVGCIDDGEVDGLTVDEGEGNGEILGGCGGDSEVSFSVHS